MHIRRPAVMQLASLNIAAKSSNYSFHGDLLSVSRFCWGYENLCFAVALFLFMKFEKIHSKTESCFVTELLYSSNRSKKVFWKLVTEPFFHGSFQTWQVMPAIYVLSASLFSLIEPQTVMSTFHHKASIIVYRFPFTLLSAIRRRKVFLRTLLFACLLHAL